MEVILSDESTAAEGGIENAETPEAELQPAEGEMVLEAEGEPEAVEEGEGEAVEVIEFDMAGTKYQVPTGSSVDEIAEELQNFATGLHSDYTKKAQEVAEQRKAIEAATARMNEQQATFDRLETMSSEAFGTFSQGLQLKAEIEQYQTALADGALWQSNPDMARQYSDTIAAKTAQLNGIQQQVAQQEAQLAQARSADIERRKAEGRELVASRVKDFDEGALVEYAVSQGVPKEDAENWALSPSVAMMAHKARLYDQLQATATRQPAKVVKPAKPVKGSAARRRVVNLNDSKTSRADWFKAREKQLAER